MTRHLWRACGAMVLAASLTTATAFAQERGARQRLDVQSYLIDAQIDPAAQLVLCAGAPDTPEIAAEIEAKVERVRAERGNVLWLQQMLPKPDVIQLLSHATVFVCPGSNGTRRKPFNSTFGLSTEEFKCLTYICTTSSPARVPMFFTSTLTTTEPRARRALALVFRFE